ncbi:MAG TPA: hypothetical protein VFT45_02565 [Longimicrobium sp.]|nr:hypothetical protein [Longimicrobium sp.]
MRTTVYVLLAGMVGAGCISSAAARPVETSGRSAGVAAELAAASPDSVTLCGVRDGRLVRLAGEVSGITGDTLVAGQPLAEALPSHLPPYAGKTEWYQTFQPIFVNKRRYPTEGHPPRHLLPEQLDPDPVTFHNGIPVFVEAGAREFEGWGGYFYVLLSPDCLFQPYLLAI